MEYQYYLGLSLKAQGTVDRSPGGVHGRGRAGTGGVQQRVFRDGRHPQAEQGLHSGPAGVGTMPPGQFPPRPGSTWKRVSCTRLCRSTTRPLPIFKQAGEMDAELMQAVYYNIAAVYFEQQQFEAARRMFEQAIAVDPQSPAAVNARRSIDNLAKAAKGQRKFYFSTTLGWGHDTNLPLEPREAVVGRARGPAVGQGRPVSGFFAQQRLPFHQRKGLRTEFGLSSAYHRLQGVVRKQPSRA